MPRTARIVVPDIPYHVTQRGNRREDVFFSDGDRRVYLELLQKYAQQHGLGIVAYCLMTNHVHLIVVPKDEDALNKAVGRTHFIYTQHVNRLHGRSGHLWQGRFYSCAMDEAHLLTDDRAPVHSLQRQPRSGR